MSRRTLYLEDFEPGLRFETGQVTITSDAIKSFAASFDPQPFHLDEQAAADSVFRGLAASGWHTAALTMRLIVDGEIDVPGGLIGLGADVSWPRPTRPGDTLRVVSEVLDTRRSRSKPDRGIVTLKHTTLNQSDEPVQVTTVKIVVPSRPG